MFFFKFSEIIGSTFNATYTFVMQIAFYMHNINENTRENF